MPLGHRVLVAVIGALLVGAPSVWCGYGRYCESGSRIPQQSTLKSMQGCAEVLESYRQAKHQLPKTMEQVWDFQENVQCIDGWHQLMEYRTDGARYRIISYGADLQPGGVGLDADLSSDDLPRNAADLFWLPLPARSRPTFRQFATDWPDPDREESLILLVALAAAGLAAYLSIGILRNCVGKGQRKLPTAMRLLGAMLAAFLAGRIITYLLTAAP